MPVSYSQYGQDEFVYQNFFKNETKGTYVDIGAYDGIFLSNTYKFYRLGWDGYCFEPLKPIFEKLQVNRNRDKLYNNPVGHKNDKVRFLKVNGDPDMLSGVMDYYNYDHMFRINKESFECKSEPEEEIVDMITLDSVVEKNSNIDYLSIDTEGGEPLILANILENFEPKIISIEINYKEDYEKLIEVIKNKYDIVDNLGCDLILKLK